jgi:predicted nuclease of predicted toxin-antitoxin system
LKLICDANIGRRIALALAAEGHDVVRSTAVVPDGSDLEVLAYAVGADRVLITCDRDFGELVFRYRATPPPAIVYVRFEPEDVLDIIPRLLRLLDFDRLKGHMAVLGAEHDRHTPFPEKS